MGGDDVQRAALSAVDVRRGEENMSQQWKDYHGQKRMGDFIVMDTRFDGEHVIISVVNVNSGRIFEWTYSRV